MSAKNLHHGPTFGLGEESVPVVDPSTEFADFMAARWNTLYRTAYLLTGNPHAAEDLLQGALARTFNRWDSIRDKTVADVYVRRAMVHQATRSWRRRDRETPTDNPPDQGHLGGIDAYADRLALWTEIRRLPPRQRAVVVLRYVEDLTVESAADELGVTVGTVKSQTHHALNRLRAALPDLEMHP